jgi:hypothetical protein
MDGETTGDILRSVSHSIGLPWPQEGSDAAKVLDRVPLEHRPRAAALVDLAQKFARQRRIASVTIVLARLKTLRSC